MEENVNVDNKDIYKIIELSLLLLSLRRANIGPRIIFNIVAEANARPIFFGDISIDESQTGQKGPYVPIIKKNKK